MSQSELLQIIMLQMDNNPKNKLTRGKRNLSERDTKADPIFNISRHICNHYTMAAILKEVPPSTQGLISYRYVYVLLLLSTTVVLLAFLDLHLPLPLFPDPLQTECQVILMDINKYVHVHSIHPRIQFLEPSGWPQPHQNTPL